MLEAILTLPLGSDHSLTHPLQKSGQEGHLTILTFEKHSRCIIAYLNVIFAS